MASVPSPVAAAPHAGRWPMAVRGFLSQNIAIGCAFGGFGVAVGDIKARYGVSSGMASMGLALAVLTMGLASPMVARLIGRYGLRRTMLTGVLLSGLGYVALAFAPNIYVVLAAFGLLIGVGIAMCGPFPSSVLASNWFQPNAGPALGFVNMPVMVAVVPMMGVVLIKGYGLPTFFLVLAALHALLVPFVLGVSDGPGGRPSRDAAHGHAADHAAPTGAGAILSRPIFWAIVLGAGGLSAAGIVGVSHLVAFAVERGVPDAQAALLLSVMGGAAALGSLLVGVLCSRLGAANTLALMGAALAGSWLVLLSTTIYPLMFAATLVIGMCGAGVFPAVNVVGAQIFGVGLLARVLGLFTFYTLPLTFALPPAAGVLRDVSVNYDPVIAVLIGGCGAIAVLFLAVARVLAARPAVSPA